MVTLDMIDRCIDIDDIGVTIRTLLAVAATGYKETGIRKWDIRYKKAVIGKLHVGTKQRPPAKITASPVNTPS